MGFWRLLLGLVGILLLGLLPGSAQGPTPQLWGGGSFAPGQKVTLEYSLDGTRQATLYLYRIGNPEKILQSGGPRQFKQTAQLALELVRSQTVYQRVNEYYSEISLGQLPEGFYLAQLGSGVRASATLVLVSQLGLVVKADPDTLLTYTAHLQTGKPLPAQVYLIDEDKVVRQARAHTEGLAMVSSAFAGGDERPLVAARSGESWAFSEAYWQSWNIERYKVYLHTDRPVYRPGQQVFFKGTLRTVAGLRPIAGREVSYLVRDPSDAEVARGKAITDAYGSFAAQLTVGLDARLGDYSVVVTWGGDEFQTAFEVQEYRKPEYRVTVEAQLTSLVQGDRARYLIKAEYLFGGPVAGGKVSYSLVQRPYYRYAYQSRYGFYEDWGYEDDYSSNVIERGEGRLNEKGELWVEWPLERSDQDYSLVLEAGVTDEAGREISGSGSLTAYRSAVVVGLETASYAYKVGQEIVATLQAQDLEGKPVSVPFTLEAVRNYWVRGKGERSVLSRTVQGQTNAQGKATVRFKLDTQGSYTLKLQATDARNRVTEAERWLWVSDNSYWYWGYKNLKVTPDQREYQPGDTARFVVESPVADGYALINLEGSQIAAPELVKFSGSVFTYELPITAAMAPNGYLSVVIVGGGEYYSQTTGFLVPPSEKFLEVKITPDKASYRPGETARYQLAVTNAQGKPVQAQVAVGLVDEAIYLVRPERAQDIRAYFWALRSNVVGTELASGYYFGNVAPVAAGAARPLMSEAVFGQAKEAMAPATVRQDFRDTVLWLPTVETDAQGQATVEAVLPDNLTEWRMTARAITRGDQMGQQTRTVVSTLPVISRLATPRFLVEGDQAIFKTIAQSNLDQAQPVELTLESPQIALARLLQAPPQLPARGRVVQSFTALAYQSGQASLEASALTPVFSDALKIPLPVLPRGMSREQGWAGVSGQQGWDFEVPEGSLEPGLQLFVQPSLLSTVGPALSYLAGYPYGCSEQTMSRFLPSVLARQVAGAVELPAEVADNLDTYVVLGLRRLYDFQHEDGGWGFWQNDASSLYMSSYITYGLLQAQKAGYAVRPEVLESAARYLARTLQRKDLQQFAPDARAYAYYALLMGGSALLGEVPQGLRALIDDPKLTPYGQALVALAYARANPPLAREALDRLLDNLTERSQVAYWQTSTSRYAWNDDQIETTARGLEALVRLQPDHPAIPKLVRWLMLQRQGARWVSTKDTAAVVTTALTLASQQPPAASSQTITVRLNGEEQQVEVGSQGATLAVGGLRLGTNRLEVAAPSPVFLSASLKYVATGEQMVARQQGLELRRRYQRLTSTFDRKTGGYVYTPRPLDGQLKVGEYLLVTLSLTPQEEAGRYVLLEEPIPAGFAVVENDDSFRIAGQRNRYGDDYYGWNRWYDGREVRDTGLEFYFSYLNRPVTFTYVLRAETPGRFTALPGQAWLMYAPEVRGNSALATLEVAE